MNQGKEIKVNSKRLLLNQLIRKERDIFLETEMFSGATYWDINNGYCEEFAINILDKAKWFSGLMLVTNENFMAVSDNKWDQDLLNKYWPNVVPINNLSWKDLNKIRFGRHIWITDGYFHYDAECPEGVENYFLLPIFKAYINRSIQTEASSEPKKRQ